MPFHAMSIWAQIPTVKFILPLPLWLRVLFMEFSLPSSTSGIQLLDSDRKLWWGALVFERFSNTFTFGSWWSITTASIISIILSIQIIDKIQKASLAKYWNIETSGISNMVFLSVKVILYFSWWKYWFIHWTKSENFYKEMYCKENKQRKRPKFKYSNRNRLQ